MIPRPRRIALVGWIALVTGCASTGGPVTLGEDGAANLDRTARQVAEDYRERCFEPIRKKKVPDDICQFQLFDRTERQWGPQFEPKDLVQTANRILGDEIEKAVMRILVFDKPSQRYVSSSTRTRYEIIQALKERYKIQ